MLFVLAIRGRLKIGVFVNPCFLALQCLIN